MVNSSSASGAPDAAVKLGRYSVTREIGRGGMCRVYEARHDDLQKTVAVKTLKPEYASQPELVERFLREGRAASRVRHRHAIEMFDVGVEGDVVYLAMELLEGEDLGQRVARDGALPYRTVVDLLLPAMAAVVEAHDVGVVHRDLKPANIFLATHRRGPIEAKVLDFGISKVAGDQGQTGTEAVLGTPTFMAPEQVRAARDTTAASDQYSLGVILYQCVTGRLPFYGESAFATFELVVRGEYTPPRVVVPSLPVGLASAITRAMALQPSARYGSVAEFGAALLPFASPGVAELWSTTFAATPSASVASAPAPSPKSRRGVFAAVAAVVLVLVVAVTAGLATRVTPTAAVQGPTVSATPPVTRVPVPAVAPVAPRVEVVVPPPLAASTDAGSTDRDPRPRGPRAATPRRPRTPSDHGTPTIGRDPNGAMDIR